LLIINKALIDYFTSGVPVGETINKSNQFSDFQKIVKVSALYLYAVHGDKKIKEKVLRVFASNKEDAPQLYKVKTEGKVEKIGNTPDKCFIMNDDIREYPIPEELDRNYYIEEAEKRLQDFYSSDRKAATKAKSEIKGVNEDVYNDIFNLDFDAFDTFVDFLVYVCENSIANKTQIGILIKLKFFEKFGKNKKLFNVATEFYSGKLKFSKSKVIAKREQNLELLRNFENETDDETFSIKDTIDFRTKYLGYFITKEQKDRPILIVNRIQDVKRKSDGNKFGKSIKTISYGSGKEAWFTILNKVYQDCGEIVEGSIVLCKNYQNKNGFFHIDDYKVLE
jgi:hypothetical protein